MEAIVPKMTPGPGERLQRFVGDRVRFYVAGGRGSGAAQGWRARLRTNLGRAEELRREILQAHTRGLPLAGASWRDIPLREDGEGWSLELPLAEAGYFQAKAYLLDPRGWQHWPAGPDVGIAVHPDRYRSANTIYCAFPRMFGRSKGARQTREAEQSPALLGLDREGYTVIPPSGTLRDLTEQLPHIIERLGCRILHLLPVHPTPTTLARFGRYGSPYAAEDLTAIDPALVVFDKRTTGIDQFRELTYATHLRGGRVLLDIVINHTGWGSVLQENHPEWFLRQSDGTFASPGAWGTTWEDLVELKHQNVALWDELAEVFLTWCRRGVDGFRCDAGYKVPVAAWQYIITRVQQEYPEALFLLEGLGGAWEATEALLTEGGMQWAYSELFQNYSGVQVSGYLDHALKQSQRVGLLVHYSETHDNERLAARGRSWSRLRNGLCALASVSGGFGFACGVEWLASEKIRVHGSAGMAWGNNENLVGELGRLNQLLAEHPCFFDGAVLTRLSAAESPVYALRRESAEGKDVVLVLVNTDPEHAQTLELAGSAGRLGLAGATVPAVELAASCNLLSMPLPEIKKAGGDKTRLTLPAGGVYCLAATPRPVGLHGEAYRRARAQAAWGLRALNELLPAESLGDLDWRSLAGAVERSPAGFLSLVSRYASRGQESRGDLSAALKALSGGRPGQGRSAADYSRVVNWSLLDRHRQTPVPPEHWLLVEDSVPFRAALDLQEGSAVQNLESIPAGERHIVSFGPRSVVADATLLVERYSQGETHVEAAVRFVPALPEGKGRAVRPTDLVLLTNGRGGMARLCVDLGRVRSKYDCVLGANLHPSLPVDRHVLAKRLRVWVNADGFISPVDFQSLGSFEAGPPAVWHFVANAGDGRTVEIQMAADMLPGRNTTVFHFTRPTAAQATGKQLPPEADVRLTLRLDIEDRNFHCETKRNAGADYHFSSHVRPLGTVAGREGASRTGRAGFVFQPAGDRQLRVYIDSGCYHAQPEWSENIAHPVEQSRAQTGSGDAYSPGWFEVPLAKGVTATLVVTADEKEPEAQALEPSRRRFQAGAAGPVAEQDPFGQQLRQAVRAFVVEREGGKTVIAGYPWFLDWGRDTFICARGLLAAGLLEEVRQMLVTFARFEQQGTLPNTIFGSDASNRDTSDAPLWFGVVAEELAALSSESMGSIRATPERTLQDVLKSIAQYYRQGTPNGIRMDPASGLIWSPSHFTWMDTNYPACTPREGYPVEIQALWIRLLRLLARLSTGAEAKRWEELADQALGSVGRYFWLEERGYFADVLLARAGQAAGQATVDDALRSNCLFLVSLGLVAGERARRCVEAVRRYLVVPGALRTLAPLGVSVPLPNRAADGRLLNDPRWPYWGRYEGDEDTRRKPAYHNGTAWTWTFPVFCEALARAWEFSPEAVAAAKAYLATQARLMQEGCLGQLPEILDGDAPHTQRGCDAQSWGATEALRVWLKLGGQNPLAISS